MIVEKVRILFENFAGLGIFDVSFETEHVAFAGLGDFVEAHQDFDVLLFGHAFASERANRVAERSISKAPGNRRSEASQWPRHR